MKAFHKVFSVIICLHIILFISCNDFEKNKSHQQTSNESIKAGKQLAAQYCASCHQLPDPSLLDAKSWENGVLPAMGPRLGIFFYGDKSYPSFRNDLNVKDYYPAQQVISFDDWQHIIDYYTATSPDSLLPAKKPVAIVMNDKLFKAKQPAFTYQMPATSFVKFFPGNTLITCDAITKKLFIFNSQLQLQDSITTPGSVTDVLQDSTKLILCNTGLLNPNNGKFGTVESMLLGNKIIADTMFKNLMRPIQITQADFDGDGKHDYLICEFGNVAGALSWFKQTDTGLTRNVLRAVPGAIKAYVNDYNKDGKPDVWALFAQGDEGIFLFTNKGNGLFDVKQVLKFPPSNGSSYFELDDFNKDGFPDIVYTCGDNADYSPILKPYHGVYIFLNDGKNNFTQKYFYPINGCYKAIAKDFDNDGDLDIATIAFFADYAHQPEEGFVYLKNNGNFNFQPYSLNAAKYGRWLTMDAGDFDNDGKIDLVLGNFSLAGKMIKSSIDWSKQPEFLVLKNIQ